MQVQSYLMFNGRTEEALRFYEKAIGAKVEMLMRFKENPDGQECNPPGSAEKVMHSSFRVGDTLVMATDGGCSGKTEFGGFSLTLSAKDEAEAEKLFKALGEGGKVEMPLAKTFFARSFGVLSDRFGLSWMVIAE